MGISVDIFVYTPVSTFVREFVGKNFAVRVCCAYLTKLERARILPRLLSRHFSPEALQLQMSTFMALFGSAKTAPVRFKWAFGEGLLKDKFAFFEASKSPIPKRTKLLAKRPFL